MHNVVYNIFYLFADIFEIFIIYRYMDLFFGWECHTKTTWIAFSYYFSATGVLHLFLDIPLLNLLFSLSALFFVACTYRTKLWKKVCAVLFLYCYTSVVELIVGGATGYVNVDITESGKYHNIAGLMIMKLLFYLGTLIFYNIKSLKMDSNLFLPIWLSSCSVPVISIIIAFTLFFNNGIHMVSLLISLSLLVILNVLVFYLYDLLSQFYMKKTDAEILEKEKQYYFHQYELMKKMQENITAYQHDVKNHMMIISELTEEKKYEEIQKYVEENIAVLPTAHTYSKTGNIYLDSILNFKFSEAEALGTQLHYQIEASEEYIIDRRDLIIILGNLLDNAITAVSDVPNKEIQFLYRENKGRIIISMMNSYDGTVIVKDRRFMSRKKDAQYHGYGLKNIQQTVEKYHGTVNITHDPAYFQVKILLYPIK